MLGKREAILGAAAVIGATALGMHHFLFPLVQSQTVSTSTPLPEIVETESPHQEPQGEEAVAPKPRHVEQPQQAPAAPIVSTVTHSTTPECTTSDECKGPRHAECIIATCRQGKCYYDESRCECRIADECDDGDPCTRNHCFARTLKCIYIPEPENCGE